MEVSALKHAGVQRHGRSPLLRLQSDEKLIALTRRGQQHAFEVLVDRYQSRLLSFCRHMLGSKEDAEDVLQEVFAAAFNAMLADERPINARPWLYRIARNRSLNHLRRVQPIGVDSMDIHLSEAGQTTADKVHKREQFRELIADVQTLPETQRTALLLRELDALSYDQIAEAMETTVPSVKSLLVRARVSLAEAAEARAISCDEVRLELGEVAEGLKRMTPPVRRHVKMCDSCSGFREQLKQTNKALAIVFPVGALLMVKKLFLAHLGSTATAGGGAAAGTAAGAAGSGLLSAGISTMASKTAAGLAAAAIVTAGAYEVNHVAGRDVDDASDISGQVAAAAPGSAPAPAPAQAPAAQASVAGPETPAPAPADDEAEKEEQTAEREAREAREARAAERKKKREEAAAQAPPAEPAPATTTPAPATTTPAPATEPAPADPATPPKTQHSGDTTTLPPGAGTGDGTWSGGNPPPPAEPATGADPTVPPPGSEPPPPSAEPAPAPPAP